jgi:glycerophosphoryl diester phosphodiesterase
VQPLIDVIREADAVERVCVGSFSDARIRRCRAALGPGLCTALGPGGVARLRAASLGLSTGPIRADCAQVPVRQGAVPIVDARLIRTAHRRGIQVHVWTIDDAEEMARLLDLGVDGIMTDRPSLLRDVLVGRGQWAGAS